MDTTPTAVCLCTRPKKITASVHHDLVDEETEEFQSATGDDLRPRTAPVETPQAALSQDNKDIDHHDKVLQLRIPHSFIAQLHVGTQREVHQTRETCQ